MRAKQCSDCRLEKFKKDGAKDEHGQYVHDFHEALSRGLVPCSRQPLPGGRRCVNPMPDLDPYSRFVLTFYLRRGVQSQWPVGFGIPNGLPRPSILIEAQACGIEWSEFFSDKFAICESAHISALRELNPRSE